MKTSATTVAELLVRRAKEVPSAAYHFFDETSEERKTLSYAELHEQARCIAGGLLRYGAGERVIVAMPTGPGFLRAFFGSLYAGLVPVPIPPLRVNTRARGRARSLDIISDADPVCAFLPADRHERESANLPNVELYDPDRLDQFAATGDLRSVPGEAPALLQYSSGTGGQPKGVLLSHGAILANLQAIGEAFGHSAESRGLSWLPLFHDMGLVGGALQPLYAGFPVCLMRPETFARRPLRWLEAISSFRATTSGGPSAAYEACIRAYRSANHDVLSALDLSSWEVSFVGAEPVHAETLKTFEEVFSAHGFRSDRFVPCYGLAENTLMVTAHRRGTPLECDTAERGRSVVSCGSTVPPTELLVVDPDTQSEVAEGGTGEVWLSGPSVGLEYFRQPEATAYTFAARCASRPDQSFLRTGDLGFVKGRRLFITGRLKNVVIVNGQNYESELLEQAIVEANDDACVLACMVFQTDDHPAELVVLVEVDHRRPPAALAAIEPRIRRLFAEEFELSIGRLLVVKRGGLVRTSSGKLRRGENREILASGSLTVLEVAPSAVQPTSMAGLEQALLELVARELHISPDECRMAQSLTSLGMDSLRASSLQGKIRDELGVDIPLVELLASRSVSELSTKAQVSAPVVAAESALTPIERSIWFAHQLDPGVAAFNLSVDVHVALDFSLETLEQATRAVLQAQPALRASYDARSGSLHKEVVDTVEPRVEHVDAPDAFRRKPFELATPPLLSVGVTPDEGGFRLFVVVHHIACDYASVGIVVEQLCDTYSALATGADPPDLGVRGRPFSASAPARSTGSRVELTQLVSDRPRASWTWNTAIARHVIDDALLQNVAEAAADIGATPHAVMLAALMALLQRYTGDETITVGVPLSFRTPELERDVGCFVSLLPLSADIGTQTTLAELSRHVTLRAASAIDYERGVPGAEQPPALPATGEPPVCNIVFAYYPRASERPDAAWRVEATHDNGALFELFFSVSQLKGETAVSLSYARDLFEPETADLLLAHFLAFVARVAQAPRVPLGALGVETKGRISLSTNAKSEAFLPVGERFARQARTTPDRVAVIFGREQLSYTCLGRHAAELASRLRRLGVGRETAVGIHLSRDPRMVVALLAVLQLGATYVALDPKLPTHRLRWMLADASAHFVITETSQRDVFEGSDAQLVLIDQPPDATARSFRPADVHPEQLAYILYTSGSTGTPKGVAVRHAGLSNLLSWSSSFFSREPAHVLASTSLGFDLSVFEILAPLCHGGTVILAETIGDLSTLAARHALTLVNTVPSALSATLSTLPRSVHTVNLAGEPLPRSLVRELFETGHVSRVFNLYGPSEDTTYSTCCELGKNEEIVSIGVPLPGRGALVGDELGAPVPVGMPGELCLYGEGLASGYFRSPRSTADRFVPHPCPLNPGQRSYRTGDRARMMPDESLRFFGRLDRQLKLRGFRIEPSEIEHVMNELPEVSTSAVLVDDRVAQNPRLVAFVVQLGPGALDEIRAHVLQRLPHYMVPHRFVVLDRLPVTRNGKLDRNALLAMLDDELDTPSRAPASALEREVLASWQSWLGTTRVGVDDNLFGRGADSLLFLRFVADVRERYGVQLFVKDVFRCATIAALCALIDDRRAELFNELDALLDRVESLSEEEAEKLLLASIPRDVDRSDF